MLEANVHQQVQSGIPTESRLILIQRRIELTCTAQTVFHPCLAQSPIKKFNPVFSDNTMLLADMGFFVSPAPALVTVSKRDQLPASV
jgi:hypothetical protein